MNKYILALDSGTTSNRAILFNKSGEIVSSAQQEFEQIYPQRGWVEHDPVTIWETQLNVAREVMKKKQTSFSEIAAIGITNQRETTLLWNKETGEPVYNAIVWQDRRTSGICDSLKNSGFEKTFVEKTGLIVDLRREITRKSSERLSVIGEKLLNVVKTGMNLICRK